MSRRDDRSPAADPLRHVPAPDPVTDPRLRPERIARARERIRQRYYDRCDVRRALIEALLVECAAP